MKFNFGPSANVNTRVNQCPAY